MSDLKYLTFKKIISETTNFYKSLDDFTSQYGHLFDSYEEFKEDKNKIDMFFRYQIGLMNAIIERIVYYDKDELTQNLFYADIGMLYEFLLKNCLLKTNLEHYITNYFAFKTFENAKNEVLKILKDKVGSEEYDRLTDIFDYVQKQRNNCIHSPYLLFQHYACENQIFLGIISLSKLFDIKINIMLLIISIRINKKTNNLVHSGAMDFASTKLDEYLDVDEDDFKKGEEYDNIQRKIKTYNSISPNNIQMEGNRSFYPYKLDFISFNVPEFINRGPKDWKDIVYFIFPLLEESFVCYYSGLYKSSLLSSITSIEFMLKTEYLRKNIFMPDILLNTKGALGTLIKEENLEKINLLDFEKDLEILNNLRNGFFHFNYEKLQEAQKIIMEEDKISNRLEIGDIEVSILSHFAYSLAQKIAKKLYKV